MFLKLCFTAYLSICILGCGADETVKIPTGPVTIDDSVAPDDIPIITLVEEAVDEFNARKPTIYYRLVADRTLEFDLEVYVEIRNELTSGGIRRQFFPLIILKNARESEEHAYGFGRWSVEFSVEIISLEELLDVQDSSAENVRFSPGTKLKPYKLGDPSKIFFSRKEETDGNL